MNRTPIELIPAIIKGSRPSQYEGESFTALEYVSKVAVKINECITEYNDFIKAVADEIDTFMNSEVADRDLFERRIEQMFADFKGVIELKYKAQDATIANAISEMIYGLPDNIAKALDQMYSNGEFDEIVYNSIANLKAEFDAIVNNTTNFQQTVNTNIANMINSMTTFENNMNGSFETLENDLRAEIAEIVQASSVADMSKSTYDSNADGVVNDSDKLGGQLPAYYAKKQELDNVNSLIETLNNSLLSMNNQISNAMSSASNALTKADKASKSVDTINNELKLKLDKGAQATDSLRLNGEPASYYAKANDAFSTYSHYRLNGTHYISGEGDIIKFVATADFVKNDYFSVNGETCIPVFMNGEKPGDNLFKSGYLVVCYKNGVTLNFNNGGAGISPESIIVYSGSEYPASPKENDIFYNVSEDLFYMYCNGEWENITNEKLMFMLIKNSVSNGGALVEHYKAKEQSYTPDANNNGFTFKSTSGNAGTKTVYIPYDIRQYKKISVKGTHSGTNNSGNRSLVDIFVGTSNQLTGITFDNDATKNGALSVYSGKGASGEINVENVGISSITSTASEPVYVAMRCNSYYGSTTQIHISELNLY